MAAPVSLFGLLRFRLRANRFQVLHVVVRARSEDVPAQCIQEVQRLGIYPGRRDAAGRVKLKAEDMLDFILG